jgi:hypothetical protein
MNLPLHDGQRWHNSQKLCVASFSNAQLPTQALHSLNATDRGFGAWLALLDGANVLSRQPQQIKPT